MSDRMARMLFYATELHGQTARLFACGMTPERITLNSECYDEMMQFAISDTDQPAEDLQIFVNTPYGRYPVTKDEHQTKSLIVYPKV